MCFFFFFFFFENGKFRLPVCRTCACAKWRICDLSSCVLSVHTCGKGTIHGTIGGGIEFATASGGWLELGKELFLADNLSSSVLDKAHVRSWDN